MEADESALCMKKSAESMWRAMGWVCMGMRRKNEYGDFLPEEKCSVEEYEMVAIPKYKNDERRSSESYKMET